MSDVAHQLQTLPATVLLELAELRQIQGQTELAFQYLSAAEQREPSYASARAGGVLLLRSGRVQEAVDWMERALERSGGPERGVALANLGSALLESGAVSAALARFEESLELVDTGPLRASLMLNLGRARQLAGDSEGAVKALSWVMANASDGGLRTLAGFWLALDDLEREDADLVELGARLRHAGVPAGLRAAAVTRLGERHGERADHVGAVSVLEQAAELWGQLGDVARRVEVLTSLGGHLYVLRRVQAALQVLDAARSEMPETLRGSSTETRLHTNRGLTLLSVGRLNEAQVELEAAVSQLRLTPDRHALGSQLRALVDLHRYRGDLAQAVALQAELAELEPSLETPLPEGGMLYSAVEDRSLSVSVAALAKAGPKVGEGPVVFFVPPAWGASGPLFPRGAVSVASFLMANGIPAEVVPLADVIDSSDDAQTAGRKLDGLVRRVVEALRPRAVGVSVTFSYLYPQGQALAEAVRRHAGAGVPILMGGPHVTYLDRETLEETPALDVVVRGEGEWTALELLEALQAGGDLADVRGITWRAPDGTIHRNKNRKLGDVRALPPVDFGLLPTTFCHRMDVSALTSRGCSFRCRFCHEFRYWGGVVREFPVSRIIGELDRLARYGNTLQGIDDSMLDMTTPLFMELVDALGHSPHVAPNFGLLTRLDTVTPQGSRAMKAAGLRWVSMGAESGSQVVLDSMNKGLKVEQAATSLRTVREAGLEAATFFIVGHPGDNLTESDRTLEFLDGLWRDGLVSWVDVSTFSPYPGTPFYRLAQRFGVRILSEDWSRWRRTNRPVAELNDYPAAAIYRTYLRMLAVQARYRGPEGLTPPGPQATGA